MWFFMGLKSSFPRGFLLQRGWGNQAFGTQILSEWKEMNTVGRAHTFRLNSGTELDANLGFCNVIRI